MIEWDYYSDTSKYYAMSMSQQSPQLSNSLLLGLGLLLRRERN